MAMPADGSGDLARSYAPLMCDLRVGDTFLRLVSLTRKADSFELFFAVERTGKFGLTRSGFRAVDDLDNVYAMDETVNFDDGRAAYAPLVKVYDDTANATGKRMHAAWER